jgi:dihydroorotase
VGVRLHIAHVSTRHSVYAVRDAKTRLFAPGQLSAEVTPHHLALTVADAKRLGADTAGKVAPPLRLPDDSAALIEALQDGTIDVIATDHAPHTPADKAAGSPGFIGLETAFGVCNTLLVQKGYCTLSGLSRLMAAGPAALLGLKDRGSIAKGLRADLVALDPQEGWTVDDDDFVSRSRNSPFLGRTLSGKVAFTIHGGRIVYERA